MDLGGSEESQAIFCYRPKSHRGSLWHNLIGELWRQCRSHLRVLLIRSKTAEVFIPMYPSIISYGLNYEILALHAYKGGSGSL